MQIEYGNFDDGTPTPDDMASAVAYWNNWIGSYSQALADQLKTSRRQDLAYIVANWQTTAAEFQNFGKTLVDINDETRMAQWVALGQRIMGTAQQLENELGTPRVSVAQILAGFPKSLDAALDWFLQFAQKPITAASSAAWQTILKVGGVAAALIVVLHLSGFKLNAGPVRLG